jgi:hypothetical protein
MTIPGVVPDNGDSRRRHRFHTGRKIYFRFCIRLTWWRDRPPLELANMPAQERELSKNYIGILSDKLQDQREALLLVKPDRDVKDYFRRLVAAMLNRGDDAR